MAKEFEGVFTHRLKITFKDESKFDEKFFEEFRATITYADELKDIAEHITHNYCYNGAEDFIEGVGNLKEMGVVIEEITQESEAQIWED